MSKIEWIDVRTDKTSNSTHMRAELNGKVAEVWTLPRDGSGKDWGAEAGERRSAHTSYELAIKAAEKRLRAALSTVVLAPVVALFVALATLIGCGDSACWAPTDQGTGQGGAPVLPPQGGYGDDADDPLSAPTDCPTNNTPPPDPAPYGWGCRGMVNGCVGTTKTDPPQVRTGQCLSSVGEGKSESAARLNARGDCEEHMDLDFPDAKPWLCLDGSALQCAAFKKFALDYAIVCFDAENAAGGTKTCAEKTDLVSYTCEDAKSDVTWACVQELMDKGWGSPACPEGLKGSKWSCVEKP